MRTRILASVAGAVLATVALTLAATVLLVRASVREEAIRSLAGTTELLAANTAIADSTPPATGDVRRGRREVVIFVSREQAALLVPDHARDIAAGRPAQGTIRDAGVDLFFAARSTTRGTLILFRPATIDIPLLPIVAVASGLAVLFAAIAALLLARGIARPVRRVADASLALARDERPGALAEDGPSEVRALSGAFNHMSRELDRMRDTERAFLLSVSHELKTPLTSIRGNAEALSDGVVEPERAAQVIVRESGRLERLVQDLLDLARLSVRGFSVRDERVELDALVDEVVERYSGPAAGFAVALAARAEPGAAAMADHDRLLQVISNLVENALRCTPAGGTVRVDARDALVRVSDTGPGLAHQDLPHAFDRFYLYDRYGRDRPVGTGLGLAVVRELTSAMGGRVTVSSDAVQGTRFEIALRPSR